MFYVLKQRYALNLIKTSFFAFLISICNNHASNKISVIRVTYMKEGKTAMAATKVKVPV